MNLNENEIRKIVEQVVEKVVSQTMTRSAEVSSDKGDWGVYTDMNEAVEAAHEAFQKYKERSLQCRKNFIDAVRKMALENKEELAEMTVEETGMGRVDHKIAKFVNAANHSPGVEYLYPKAWSGKNGLAIDEYAPFGVIGNISPSTHPGPTIINNIIIQLAGGNTIVFNPHPSAKKVSAKVIQLANKYMVAAGAPKNLVTCVAEPTLETAKILFGHEKVELLSVTGGPQVVKMALQYLKKVIAAGPGNPPVLVDETADLELAAKEITMSASFDNNILCIAEKEIFVVDTVFEQFMDEMKKAGNYRLSNEEMNRLAEKALELSGKHWLIKREFAGKSAAFLGSAIGLKLQQDVPLLFGEVEKNHPWVVAEQMTCCIPVVRVRDFEEGLQAALKAEHGFKHTASIFSKDIERVTRFTRILDCDVHVINGGTLRGNGGDLGEGYFSHTIATPTGEGICTPIHFVRKRRIMTHKSFRFV
ncbi:aldehyde dehydrogenase family protein [Melioribacter sp. OK-6-Me]|uniref:aldehyde dehydrogenase family protein n=1 Tax=unclassified Melioribacter TaxID=2627329 RepID=UPI003ED9283A